MDDSESVSCCKRAEHWHHDRHQWLHLEPSLVIEMSAQGGTIDQLHHDEDAGRPSLIPALILDHDDIGVRESRSCLGLTDETSHIILVIGQVRVHDLDRYFTIKAQVERCVDRRHATGIHDPGELIATVDYLTGQIRHGSILVSRSPRGGRSGEESAFESKMRSIECVLALEVQDLLTLP